MCKWLVNGLVRTQVAVQKVSSSSADAAKTINKSSSSQPPPTAPAPIAKTTTEAPAFANHTAAEPMPSAELPESAGDAEPGAAPDDAVTLTPATTPPPPMKEGVKAKGKKFTAPAASAAAPAVPKVCQMGCGSIETFMIRSNSRDPKIKSH